METPAPRACVVLQVEKRDGVAWLTKTNPDVGYGISLAMIDALTAALDELAADPHLRAVVIDAEGTAMQGGAVMVTELKPSLADLTRDDVRSMIATGHRLGRQIASMHMPVIGLAAGGAFGGGLELLLRSDLIYTVADASFSFPEVTLGLVAGWGGTQLAPRTMPFRKAQEFLLLGESITGSDAERLGLVTRCFTDRGSMDEHVSSVLERLRYCSPAALRWTKACLAAVWDGPLTYGEEVEADAEVETMASGDTEKAVGAFYNDFYFNFERDIPGPRR